MKQLGDVATYINGYAFKPTDYTDEGRQIIRIQDLTGNAYQTNRYSGTLPEKYEVSKGDVLISWSASLGVYVWEGEPALLNQHIFKVVFDKAPIDKDFFIHQASYRISNASSLTHGATMKHLTKKVFDSMPFWVPDGETQVFVARQLNRIDSLIKYRQQEIKQLDNLVKSRFIEMFGDPKYNPKEWAIGSVNSLSENLDSFRVPITQSERLHGSYPYYGASGQVDTVVDYLFDEDLLLISEDGANLLTRTYPIAFSISGKTWVNNHAHVLRCENTETQTYLEILLNQIDISNYVTGSAQPKLNQKQLNAIPIMLPPFELKKQFNDFMEQIDKSKFAIQKAIDKLELLKASLMQEYFG